MGDKPVLSQHQEPPRIRQMSWRLDANLIERLEEYAAKSIPRTSLPAHVEAAIIEYLDRHDPVQPTVMK
jgi:hypothetical protein